MKTLLKRLTKVEQHTASPSGSLDKKGVKVAAGAGLAMAPVGAYTGEFVALIYEFIDANAPAFVQKMTHLSFAEDLIGGATGFLVGTAMTAIWKFMRHYE
jgi:hypothetical protein